MLNTISPQIIPCLDNYQPFFFTAARKHYWTAWLWVQTLPGMLPSERMSSWWQYVSNCGYPSFLLESQEALSLLQSPLFKPLCRALPLTKNYWEDLNKWVKLMEVNMLCGNHFLLLSLPSSAGTHLLLPVQPALYPRECDWGLQHSQKVPEEPGH